MSPLNDTKQSGRTYWRSLDELERSAEFQEYVDREFPEGASELSDPFSRRGFMKAMAASFALAGGLVGCRRPEEKILPYTDAPEHVIPGKSFNIATSAPRSRGSLGLLVRSSEGRPTKIEGLPNHPANNGSTDSMAQADLLDLYNPFRQKSVRIGDHEADFSEGMNTDYRMASRKLMKEFEAKLAELNKKHKAVSGDGLAFLSSPVTSPTQIKVMEEVRKEFPNAKWYSWESINDDRSSTAVKHFTGSEGYDNQVVYDLSKADRILSLDSDFMMNERNSVKMLQDYADKRRIYRDEEGNYEDKMSLRFYAVESAFTVTGSNADHRLRLKSGKITDFIFALAKEIAKNKEVNSDVKTIINNFSSTEKFSGKLNYSADGAKFLAEIAKDLLDPKNAGKSVIIVGERQPASVHLLALVLNQVLGNIGTTVKFTEKAAKSVTFNKDNFASQSISKLSADIDTDSIETLFILDGNPVFDAPADAKLAEKIKKVKEIITLSLFPTETTDASTVVVPKSHFLESWGDTRAYDGTISFVQPLIAPLYGSLTETELLAKFLGKKTFKSYEAVKANYAGKSFEADLQKGFIAGTAFKAKSVSPNWGEISHILKNATAGADKFELVFAPDYSTYDGRYNNNGWMHELPDPITKLTWDNAVLISYGTAKAKELENRDLVTIKANGATLTAPVWIVPGMPDNTAQISLGYGRTSVGEKEGDRAYVVFTENGFNAYPLRTTDNSGYTSCEFSKTEGTYDLVTTQDHWAMEDRDLVKEVTLKDFDTNFEKTVKKQLADKYHTRSKDKLYVDRKEFSEAKYQWAMVIDLNSCVGCSACTIACQAENNIPVVGKERVSEGREMHWIRMDRYFYSGPDTRIESWYGEGDKYDDNEEANKEDLHDMEVGALHQPIPCMQCEEAPCEQVCPVAATQHSPEGLNDMVYNRCIGTRYCLNNCPYKVRRFNYFNFQEDFKNKKFEVKKMVHNPSVSVRSRGVMEKCTYCVQRINEAKIDAKVRKDENIINSFTTACAQVCPTKAITFGNKNDEKTEVSKMRKESRSYTLLPHLNVRPRTSFLGKVTDPNENLVSKVSQNKGDH